MAISTEPSTFEYAQNWLVSSEAFCRDAMGADALDLDTARNEARKRIHRDEVLAEPNDDAQAAHAPDLAPPVDSRPLAIVIERDNQRTRIGTGSWRAKGLLAIAVEVVVPQKYLFDADADDAATKAQKFKDRKTWATQLSETIRSELLGTSGRGDAQGNAYLNAERVDVYVPPSDPEPEEDQGYVFWMYEVEWR
ncbi:MAG: hypothetical protein KY476_24615 [Planctomycetes bacterium]|nr:hypothetical protein [Planctomycetota bacterium]